MKRLFVADIIPKLFSAMPVTIAKSIWAHAEEIENKTKQTIKKKKALKDTLILGIMVMTLSLALSLALSLIRLSRLGRKSRRP